MRMVFVEYFFLVLIFLVVCTLFAVVVGRFMADNSKKVDRKVSKARATEENVGNRIVNALTGLIMGKDYHIVNEHKEWGQGYHIKLAPDAHSWPPPLLIVVDCSRSPEQVISVSCGQETTYYLNTDNGVLSVLDLAEGYMIFRPHVRTS